MCQFCSQCARQCCSWVLPWTCTDVPSVRNGKYSWHSSCKTCLLTSRRHLKIFIKAKAPTWILGFVLHPPVYNSNIIMHNHNRISLGSLFFHLYMHVLIKWSELWKLGTMMPWTFLDPNTRNLIYLLEYYLTTMAHFMVCEPGPSNF